MRAPVHTRRRSARSEDERGGVERGEAAVVWCLLVACLLLPLAGISVDLWHAISVQRSLQSAAEDAAAAAASAAVDVARYREAGCVSLVPAVAEQMARQALARQPLGALSAADIVVGPGDATVSVTLEQPVQLTLLRIVDGGRPIVVAASASARANSTSGSPQCGP